MTECSDLSTRAFGRRVFRKRMFAVRFVPRTVPVWHPIEEFTACVRVTSKCTDRSLSISERRASPPVAQFIAEVSEGFQGAGAVVRTCR